MATNKTGALFLALVSCWWVVPVADADDFIVDEQGRRLRVRFDPGNQVRLGLVGGVSKGSRWEGIGELELGLAFRFLLEFAEEKQHICWQLDHRALWGWMQPWAGGSGGLPRMDLIAYSGSFLRHTAAPYMVLPTSPPRRLFFPFDIGVETELGRVQVAPGAGSTEVIRLGVARASVLLDPWRSGRPGNSLEIGLGVRYSLDLVGASTWDDPDVIHRVAPFTDTSIRFRVQDEPGLTVLDVRAHLVPHWASRAGWDLSISSTARFERVLLAVNDEPVSFVVQADYEYNPGLGHPIPHHDFRAIAGLALGFQLK